MKSARDLGRFEWAPDRCTEAMRALARGVGVQIPARFDQAIRRLDATTTFATALPDRARAAGLDVEPIDVPAVDALASLRRAAPAIVTVSGRGGFLVVLRARGRTATLIGPDGTVRIPIAAVEDALWAPVEGADVADAVRDSRLSLLFQHIDSMSSRRRICAARALLAPSLTGRPLGEGWIVRRLATGMKDELRAARIHRRFAGVILAYLVQFALFIAIWNQVGTHVWAGGDAVAAGGGQGWGGFMALLGLWVVVQLAASSTVGRLALDVGGVVRAGLMRGALRLDPGRMRTAGVGQLLGRALDAEVVDGLALGSGVEATAGVFELLLGVAILASGATPAGSLTLLGLVLAGLAVATLFHARRLSAWCRIRRALTHDLVERMIGHRTALIQDRPARRATADAAALRGYDRETRALDRAEIWLSVALPRGWLLVGLLALTPLGFRSGSVSTSAIAMSLAGVWLVYGALRRVGVALPMLSLARESWGQVASLVGAIESDTTTTDGTPDMPTAQAERVVPLLEMDAVAYRYPDRPARVLDNVSLSIAAGERVLVEGASGGGKSTLAGLLTGLKTPIEGRLSLRGIDQRSMGLVQWRRAVGGAPQFHDNHVMGADLLFNLLMGRRWPPRMDDVMAAERVCQELGLGSLIGRMPAGIQQLVGETGWQLSHGERSRLFIARSLLQILDVRVLDESFAALDPETLDQVVAAVLSRPEALIVIAHP